MRSFVVLIAIIAVFGYANALGEGFGRDLSNIDFKNLIGGPMQAVIQAQAISAKTTTDFIHMVGFTPSADGTTQVVKTVGFSYQKLDNGTLKNYTLTVPFILMMPVPYIEIEELHIDLNVKLNSVETSESSNQLDTYAEVGGRVGGWFAKVNFKAGFSYQSTNKQSGEVKREYALAVHVQCTQAGMPKGTERVLDILETVIRETPKA